MAKNDSIIKFDEVSFHYELAKPIMKSASFSLRRGAKVTLMGQNGAGKSTLFKLLTDEIKPEDGRIIMAPRLSVAISRQVVPRDQLDDSVRDFFQSMFIETIYDIDKRIKEILEVVHLPLTEADYDKPMRNFSGGQQARLLLASALIQEPDLLLLDEPTNNLDTAGIEHLTTFLQEYTKTVVVISHDADFLNAFTEGVLYLDVYSKTIEQYVGDYYDVLEQVGIRIEKEKRKNARLEKSIQDKKDKANFFAKKGGRLRAIAKQMREEAAEAEENKVDVRKDDKTIRDFIIPCQEDFVGEAVKITSFTRLKNGKITTREADVSLRRNMRLLLVGPNGIGKSTLLESLATGTADGARLNPDVRVGYYRQDFSTLNFDDTVFESLAGVMERVDQERLRSVAASFLITKELINNKIGSLSEGQKGLVAFARLVLQRPGLLILDEPTNHINFRHLPIIAKALDQYQGAMIMVSHVSEFVEQIRIDEVLDLGK
ncbi:ABC-F family ATP-binding cassette domain-containing protein [Candidatus Nomurabacteria bacterium]|nr:ABC-F family ATP-binding cassette domain-containing protein [Candidatus Nomurabacteria bacterium]